ncbi:hypothetical protein H4Q26_018302 [Puccinia striiformis f. sp. tritici PST-130]|nr:hypothetical protein H4Q26_018302 [Puccinia striiformis f. sp. tritici PST-130]
MSKKKNQDRTNQNSSSATAAKPTTPSKTQAKKIRRKIRRQEARSIAAQALEEETFDLTPDDDKWIAVYWSCNGAHSHKSGHQHSLPYLDDVAKVVSQLQKRGFSLTKTQLKARFTRICRETLQFSTLYNKLKDTNVTRLDADLVEAAKQDYNHQTGKPFLFESAWHVLRVHPIWTGIGREGTQSTSASSKKIFSETIITTSSESKQQPPPASKSTTPRRSSHRIASTTDKQSSISRSQPSRDTDEPDLPPIVSESEYQPSSDYHLSDPGSPNRKSSSQPRHTVIKPTTPSAVTQRTRSKTHNPVKSIPSSVPEKPRSKPCRPSPELVGGMISNAHAEPPCGAARLSSDSVSVLSASHSASRSRPSCAQAPSATRAESPPMANQAAPTATDFRIQNQLVDIKPSSRKRAFEEVEHPHSEPTNRPDPSRNMNSNRYISSPPPPTEEQKINRLQLEVKKLEAETEYERIQLDIMDKDLDACTDPYQKEFFLYKKRKILSGLKAKEESLNSVGLNHDLLVHPSPTVVHQDSRPKSFIQIIKSSLSTGIL